uniref:Uncharacterized protein n=1 Tax=Arundo donax TaxID=35708 RepID=A0A0A9A861_ARUDO
MHELRRRTTRRSRYLFHPPHTCAASFWLSLSLAATPRAATTVASPTSLTLALTTILASARNRRCFSGWNTPSPLCLRGRGGRAALGSAAATTTAGVVPSSSFTLPSYAI